MKHKKSVLSYGLLLITLGVSLFFNWQNYKTQLRRSDIETTVDGIDRYGASVLQIGGPGSRLTQKTAYSLGEDHGYLPSENLVPTSFNGPADVMWVGCAAEYIIFSCESSSNNKVLFLDERTCGINIEEKLQNWLQIQCEEMK